LSIKIDLQKCISCAVCVNVCPFGCLSIKDNKISVSDGCTLCGACREECPNDAIIIEEPLKTASVSTEHQGVWVFAEQRNSKLKGVSFELLAKGRELAGKLKTDVSAVCFGHSVENIEQLFAFGADKVYLVDSPELAANPEDILTRLLEGLVRQYKPEIVLAGATALCRSFIPRVAGN
jgi:electron transfer flavoprotein alpha subunit